MRVWANPLWKQPEQNLTEAASTSFAFGRVQKASSPERLELLTAAVDALRKRHPLDNIKPDVRLIGVGDAYVRTLAAAGHPVLDDNLRSKRPDDAPVLLMRNGKSVKAHWFPKTTIHDANGMSLNGIELPPLDFDPKQFTIQRDLSPNYKPRPDGSDYGVDLDRLAKAIASGRPE